jgi:chromosome partitioning protein
MKIIAFVNNKGGVGKTTCSRTMAEYLSKVKKLRTLAIDFDPQCNFTQRYMKMDIDPHIKDGKIPPLHPHYDPEDPDDKNWDGRSSIAEIFYGNGVVPYPTYIEHLDFAAGHAQKLREAELVRKTEVVEKVHNRLKEFLDSPDVKESYDVVVIDTAPSKGPLTMSALKAATHIVIPTEMEDMPLEGLYGLIQLWMQESVARSKNNALKLIGILATKFKNNTTLHKNLLHSLIEHKEIGKYMIPEKLGDRILFPELDSDNAHPRSIFDVLDNNPAKIEALKVCSYIAERVFNHA